MPIHTSVNSLIVSSRKCYIEGCIICDHFDPSFSSERPETPSCSVFLGEACSEKIKQMPQRF